MADVAVSIHGILDTLDVVFIIVSSVDHEPFDIPVVFMNHEGNFEKLVGAIVTNPDFVRAFFFADFAERIEAALVERVSDLLALNPSVKFICIGCVIAEFAIATFTIATFAVAAFAIAAFAIATFAIAAFAIASLVLLFFNPYEDR